jgi:hypothetical protein
LNLSSQQELSRPTINCRFIDSLFKNYLEFVKTLRSLSILIITWILLVIIRTIQDIKLDSSSKFFSNGWRQVSSNSLYRLLVLQYCEGVVDLIIIYDFTSRFINIEKIAYINYYAIIIMVSEGH